MRRYFGQKTTWYLHEYTTLRLLLKLTKAFDPPSVSNIKGRAVLTPRLESRGLRGAIGQRCPGDGFDRAMLGSAEFATECGRQG